MYLLPVWVWVEVLLLASQAIFNPHSNSKLFRREWVSEWVSEWVNEWWFNAVSATKAIFTARTVKQSNGMGEKNKKNIEFHVSFLSLSGCFTPCRHLRPSSGREHSHITYSVLRWWLLDEWNYFCLPKETTGLWQVTDETFYYKGLWLPSGALGGGGSQSTLAWGRFEQTTCQATVDHANHQTMTIAPVRDGPTEHVWLASPRWARDNDQWLEFD